ncbi:methyl-CpG-binding domain-containing protein 2-like isoform X2 [Cornus florida]|uniref:methyl-CpG-binding domain-containing protein 2-like isoform X2 n=1 Tax=Cornus florida TaxID=4283 RepID=UPI00289F670C|nr:methyl-CpG-binding domain-containing protein 2-like isoform X2 [Cornus florida]
MQSRPTKLTFKVKKEENGTFMVKKDENGFSDTTISDHLESTLQQSIDLASSNEDEDHGTEDEDNQSCENAQNQLVVYDPASNGTGQIEAVPDPIGYQPSTFRRFQSSRVLPSVGAFTVQCANCFKWRLIPTKEKYEEIREHILELPFVCETAREWRPEISCEDPADISQDGSRLWAIDKPNIAQPPPGWQRLLRIRGEGSTKFADVYYVAPSGKRLRSMVEIQRHLLEHPEYMAKGVTMSQFSFQIPRPLQENYVRKRPTRLTVNPIAWAGPNEGTDLQLGGPGLSTPYFEAPVFEPVNRPPKQARR